MGKLLSFEGMHYDPADIALLQGVYADVLAATAMSISITDSIKTELAKAVLGIALAYQRSATPLDRQAISDLVNMRFAASTVGAEAGSAIEVVDAAPPAYSPIRIRHKT